MQQEANAARRTCSGETPSIAWDTSSTVLDVAIKYGERIERIHEHAGRRHNEMLAPAIEALLDRMSLTAADLSSVACCRGPGSFTGLRIGIATAKGLVAGVSTSLPYYGAPGVVGIPTLMAYTYAVGTQGVVLAAIDGRKQRFYAALYRGKSLLWGPADATPQKIHRAIETHIRQPETVTMVGPDNAILLERLEESARQGSYGASPEILDRLRPDTHYEAGIATTLIEIAEQDTDGTMSLAPDAGPDYLRVSQAEE